MWILRTRIRSRSEILHPFVAAGLAGTLGYDAKCRAAACSTTDAPDVVMMTNWSGSFFMRLSRRRRGADQRIAREDLGWKTMRTGRSRALVGDTSLQNIAALINKLVDLESWDEDQEQELFEHAVAQCLEEIAIVLPPPFHDLLHTDIGFLEKSSVDLLAGNLIDKCRHTCSFPYLDEQDKRRIIRAVVMVIMEALKEGKTLETFARGLETDMVAQDILVAVFIEGAMDVFFDDEMRRELVEDVTSYITDLPFVPPAVIYKIADYFMKAFSGILSEALKEAFKSFKQSQEQQVQLPVLPYPLEDDQWVEERDRVLEVWKDKAFVIQLRRIFVVKLLGREDEILGKGAQFFKCLLSQQRQAMWVGRAVDTIFQNLPGLEKIEDTVQPFHKSPHSNAKHPESGAPEENAIDSNKDNSDSVAPLNWDFDSFISLEQPFGFSDSVVTEYLESIEVSDSSSTSHDSPFDHNTSALVSPTLTTRGVERSRALPLDASQTPLLAPETPKPSRIRPNPISQMEFQERIAALELKVMGGHGHGSVASRLNELESLVTCKPQDELQQSSAKWAGG